MPEFSLRTAGPGRLRVAFDDATVPAPDAAEVDWYLARVPAADAPLLQAMSGSGRLLLALLQSGRRMHGVEASEAALAACQARLAAATGQAAHDTVLFRQELPRLNVPFRYPAAIIADAAFQGLSDPVAALDGLLRLRAHLVDPGILLLDLVVPAVADHPPGAPVIEVRRASLADGSQIALRSETTVELEARLLTIAARYEQRLGPRSLAREDETRTSTWYDEAAITQLVEDAGYRDVRIESAPTASRGGRRFGVSARL